MVKYMDQQGLEVCEDITMIGLDEVKDLAMVNVQEILSPSQ
jgi:hypothetical protein